jgi:hypothetical protein
MYFSIPLAWTPCILRPWATTPLHIYPRHPKKVAASAHGFSREHHILLHVSKSLCPNSFYVAQLIMEAFETVMHPSVGIATDYGLDSPGIESWWGREFPHLSRPVLGPTMGTGSFPGVESGRGVTLTPHPLLAPRSNNRVVLYLYSP